MAKGLFGNLALLLLLAVGLKLSFVVGEIPFLSREGFRTRSFPTVDVFETSGFMDDTTCLGECGWLTICDWLTFSFGLSA